MDNFATIRGDCSGERNLSVLANLAFIGPEKEHVALLVEDRKFVMFRRKDDLLADGVAAIFGLWEGEAELLALCFHGERFTPTEAANWLVERRIKPLLFVPSDGADRCR